MCEDDGRWLSNIAKPDYEIPVCIQIVLMTALFYICFFVVILDFCAYKSSKTKNKMCNNMMRSSDKSSPEGLKIEPTQHLNYSCILTTNLQNRLIFLIYLKAAISPGYVVNLLCKPQSKCL